MSRSPFLCLGIGLLFGLQNLRASILKVVDSITNISFIILMLTIGANIGINDSLMSNLPRIWLLQRIDTSSSKKGKALDEWITYVGFKENKLYYVSKERTLSSFNIDTEEIDNIKELQKDQKVEISSDHLLIFKILEKGRVEEVERIEIYNYLHKI